MDAEAAIQAARTKVSKRAQAWVERIDDSYSESMEDWISSHEVFVEELQITITDSYAGSIVGIKDIHPKYSQTADSVTSEWRHSATNTQYAWLFADAHFGSVEDIAPDERWKNLLGVAYPPGNGLAPVVIITRSVTANNAAEIIAHEIGHATHDVFSRQKFGEGDHTPDTEGTGLMRAGYAGDTQFSLRERKILRGILP